MAMLRQECGWFDDVNHSSAALSARLTGDAGNLQSVCVHSYLKFVTIECIEISFLYVFQVIGFPLGVILQSISTLLVGIIISMFYSVKLTLICVAALPISLAAIIIESKSVSQFLHCDNFTPF